MKLTCINELPAFNNWVSCDNCDKSRRVAQEPTADKWYCSDNLDAEHSACSVPKEMSDAKIDIELNQIQATALHAVALDACWRHGWSERGNATSATGGL